MTEHLLSQPYIGGFFDGEGCVTIAKNFSASNGKRVYYLRVSIHQVDPRPLQAIMARYGGSMRMHHENQKRQPIWEWAVSNRLAKDFLADILPNLLVKHEQAELGIEFQNSVEERDRLVGRVPLTESEMDGRETLYAQMRSLKKVA